MKHEIVQRLRAIRLRITGTSVCAICHALGRSRDWFYVWWQRYQHEGVSGLSDRSHRPHTSPRRLAPELEQAILAARRRLARQRYATIGAPTIQRELHALGYPPIKLRTIWRVLQRHHLTRDRRKFRPKPRVRPYPLPPITRSGQWHQLDFIGPRFLSGSHRKFYFFRPARPV